MHYDEIRIELDCARAEALAAWLGEEGLGFQEADHTTLDPPPAGRVRFHLFVPPAESAGLLPALRQAAGATAQLLLQRRDEDEWRDGWKRHFTTRRLGRLAIVPSWEVKDHVPVPGEVTLQLDPGRAFGTGGHA